MNALPVCGWLLTLAVVMAPAAAAPRIYEVTPEQLTQEASTQFPQRRCAGEMACVTIRDPAVRIVEGESRLRLSAHATPAFGAQSFAEGKVEIGALPEYRSDDGAFYLKDMVLTQFEFPGLDPVAAATVGNLLRPLIAEALASTPVWALDETDPRQAMLRIVLEKVEVIDGKLRLTIGR